MTEMDSSDGDAVELDVEVDLEKRRDMSLYSRSEPRTRRVVTSTSIRIMLETVRSMYSISSTAEDRKKTSLECRSKH